MHSFELLPSPIRVILFWILFGTCLPLASAVEPELEWRYETGGKIYAPPAVADLDGDGRNEVVAVASRDKRVLCLSGSGELIWEYYFDDAHLDGIQAPASIIDIDGDGFFNILVITKAGLMACLNHEGAIVWRTYIGDQVDYSGPVLADINGDDRIEIVFGSESGTLYCFDDTGSKLWHYQDGGPLRGVPAVAPQDGADTLRLYAAFSEGAAVCLDADATVVWRHVESSPRKEQRSGPAVGDLDGDGRLEVCFATEDCEVIARDAETGDERWRWKAVYAVDQTHSFALASFERTSGLDIVLGDGLGLSRPGNLYRLRNGQPIWTAEVGGGIVQGPAIGDVDGDGALEILACSRSSRLVCYSADGELEWDFPTAAGSLTTPTLADVDSDGEVEILFTSKDRNIYCLSVGGAFEPDRLPWPRLGKNNQLTNFAGTLPAIAKPRPIAASSESTLSVDGFEANTRMGENAVEFHVRNPVSRRARLELNVTVQPPAGPISRQTIVRDFEPGEVKTVSGSYEVLYAGEYELAASLVALGTDTVVATESRTYTRALFANEQIEEAQLLDRIGALRDHRGSSPVTRLANEAVASLVNAPAAFDHETPAGAARAQIAAMHERLDGLQRIAEKLDAAASVTDPNARFAVLPTSTMHKVYRDEVFLKANAKPAEIRMAKNEYEGIQLVVVPLWRDLANLRVRATDFRHADEEALIPSKDIELNRVGYVTVGPPEYNFPVYKVGGDHPDVLFAAEPHSVQASQDAQPFFVTIRTRPETPPGQYEGSVVFEADGHPAFEVPLIVRVWDFVLPDHTHLKTSFWFSEPDVQRFYGYQDGVPTEVLNRFLDFHLEHRLGPIKAFNKRDLEATAYAMKRGQNALFYSLPAYVPPEEREAFLDRLEKDRAHIQELGWDDAMVFYTRDEVAVMGRHEIPRVVEFAEWLGDAMPEWPRLQTSAPEEQLIGMADIWCPTVDDFDPEILADRMARGERLWFYTVWGRPGILIEFPGTDTRLMFWQCWKYGAEGYLYWSTNHWDLNMQGADRWPAVPWIPWNRQPGHNGDGYLIYPGPDGTPLASIRLELVRDGIEDYEYLYLLRELYDQAGDALGQELAERVTDELEVDPVVFRDKDQYTEVPAVLEGARVRIGDLIETLKHLGQ